MSLGSFRTRAAVAALGAVALAAGAIAMNDVEEVEAADHLDPNFAAAMPLPAEDIADLYAYTKDDNAVFILTYAGLTTPGGDPTYDADVAYAFHIDSNFQYGDTSYDEDITIWARFGQNAKGDWGVQITGLPGEDGPLVHKVGETFTNEDGTIQVHTGVFDDPFFFDLGGFQDTIATGDLAFDKTDDIAGTNVNAIVIEMPVTFVNETSGTYGVWASSSTIGN
jgi:hypothetical protein